MKREYGYKARTGGPRYQDMGRNEAPTEPDVVINEKPLNDVEEELELDENAAKPVVDATVEDETLTAVEPEQVPAEPADMAETDSLLDEMAEEEAVVVEEKEEVGDLPDNLTGFMDMDSKQLNPEEAEKKAKEDAAEEAAMSEEEGTSTNDELKDTKKDIKPKAKSKKSKSNDSKRSK